MDRYRRQSAIKPSSSEKRKIDINSSVIDESWSKRMKVDQTKFSARKLKFDREPPIRPALYSKSLANKKQSFGNQNKKPILTISTTRTPKMNVKDTAKKMPVLDENSLVELEEAEEELLKSNPSMEFKVPKDFRRTWNFSPVIVRTEAAVNTQIEKAQNKKPTTPVSARGSTGSEEEFVQLEEMCLTPISKISSMMKNTNLHQSINKSLVQKIRVTMIKDKDTIEIFKKRQIDEMENFKKKQEEDMKIFMKNQEQELDYYIKNRNQNFSEINTILNEIETNSIPMPNKNPNQVFIKNTITNETELNLVSSETANKENETKRRYSPRFKSPIIIPTESIHLSDSKFNDMIKRTRDIRNSCISQFKLSSVEKIKIKSSPNVSPRIPISDLRKTILEKNLETTMRETTPLREARKLYNSFSCRNVLSTPRFGENLESPTNSSALKRLSVRLQRQCLMLQDSPNKH